jgi:hypothetical protein
MADPNDQPFIHPFSSNTEVRTGNRWRCESLGLNGLQSFGESDGKIPHLHNLNLGESLDHANICGLGPFLRTDNIKFNLLPFC